MHVVLLLRRPPQNRVLLTTESRVVLALLTCSRGTNRDEDWPPKRSTSILTTGLEKTKKHADRIIDRAERGFQRHRLPCYLPAALGADTTNLTSGCPRLSFEEVLRKSTSGGHRTGPRGRRAPPPSAAATAAPLLACQSGSGRLVRYKIL